jgi:hypothetical protein
LQDISTARPGLAKGTGRAGKLQSSVVKFGSEFPEADTADASQQLRSSRIHRVQL